MLLFGRVLRFVIFRRLVGVFADRGTISIGVLPCAAPFGAGTTISSCGPGSGKTAGFRRALSRRRAVTPEQRGSAVGRGLLGSCWAVFQCMRCGLYAPCSLDFGWCRDALGRRFGIGWRNGLHRARQDSFRTMREKSALVKGCSPTLEWPDSLELVTLLGVGIDHVLLF